MCVYIDFYSSMVSQVSQLINVLSKLKEKERNIENFCVKYIHKQ